MWSSVQNFRTLVRRLDAYPKTLDDFRIQTWSGGLITLISVVLMLVLFASELIHYLRPEPSESIYVDTMRRSDNRLRINFDLIVPKIHCNYLTLDAMDVSGAQHIDIVHNVFKTRLNKEGRPIEEPRKEEHIGETKNDTHNTAKNRDNKIEDDKVEKGERAKTSSCGSCYGAESRDRPCCQTCEDVRRAYVAKTWKFEPKGIAQCANLNDLQPMGSEGCQIYGFIDVNRVAGSFHLGPGRSFSVQQLHVHDVQPYASTDFDMSHTINHLSFGQHKFVNNRLNESSNEALHENHYDVVQTNPLDGQGADAEQGATMFHYYIKVVPTLFVEEQGINWHTYQFSVTKHQRVVSVLSGDGGMPGVFFSYELAPFMIKLTTKQKSLPHFLASLCAIIGGIFTVAGIVDRIVYASVQIVRQKGELGKTT